MAGRAALSEEELLTIPFKALVFLISGLPLSALLICVTLSIALHWNEATRTHCEVENWLPSVSAAVASYSPERYIWRVSIALHAAPRIAVAFAFKNYLLTSALRPFAGIVWFPWACHLACAIHLAELLFLLALTFVSSMDDYFLHKLAFCGFIISATAYMYMSTWLFDYSGRRRTTSLGEVSFQYKVLCCVGSTASLLFALYFFYRHNQYCEPGIYTLFALSEYAVVVFNILFHSTVMYDFHSKSLTLINTSSATYYYDALPMHTKQLE